MTAHVFFFYAFCAFVGMLLRDISKGTEDERLNAVAMLVLGCAMASLAVWIDDWLPRIPA